MSKKENPKKMIKVIYFDETAAGGGTTGKNKRKARGIDSVGKNFSDSEEQS